MAAHQAHHALFPSSLRDWRFRGDHPTSGLAPRDYHPKSLRDKGNRFWSRGGYLPASESQSDDDC